MCISELNLSWLSNHKFIPDLPSSNTIQPVAGKLQASYLRFAGHSKVAASLDATTVSR